MSKGVAILFTKREAKFLVNILERSGSVYIQKTELKKQIYWKILSEVDPERLRKEVEALNAIADAEEE